MRAPRAAVGRPLGAVCLVLSLVLSLLLAAGLTGLLGGGGAAEAQPAAGQPGSTGRTVGGAFGGFAPDGDFLWLPQATLDRELDLMVSSGATWVRVGVVWSVVEPRRGQYDWRTSDRVIAAARARGLRVLALLTYAPAWASGSENDKVAPRDPADITPLATAAARRYAPQGVHDWEVWNEPNIASAWAPRPSVSAYAALLRAASRGLRAGDRAASVVTGGLSPAPDARDGSQISPLTFLKGLYGAGAGAAFDAVGLHPYSFPALPAQAGTSSWNAFQRAPLLHSVMASHGDGSKRIWFTEFGAPTGQDRGAVSESGQALGVTQAFRLVAAWSWAGPLFYYGLRDSGTAAGNREQNFGLLRHDFAPKPAWAAYRDAMGRPLG